MPITQLNLKFYFKSPSWYPASAEGACGDSSPLPSTANCQLLTSSSSQRGVQNLHKHVAGEEAFAPGVFEVGEGLGGNGFLGGFSCGLQLGRRRTQMLLHHEALGAADLDDAEAAVGANLLLHAVEVVLHGLFGKAEVAGNFFVGKPSRNQRNQLLLAPREPESLVDACRREASGFVLDIPEQRRAERAGANGFSSVDGFYRLDDVFRGSVRGKIASHTGANALQEVAFVAGYVNQKNEQLRTCRTNLANGCQVFLQVSFRGEEENLCIVDCGNGGPSGPCVREQIVLLKGVSGGVLSNLCKRLRGLAVDDLDIAVLREHAGKCFAQEAVLRGNKDAGFGQMARRAVSVRAIPGVCTVPTPVGSRASVSAAVRARVPIAIGADWGPWALHPLRTPPRRRAHDGILSNAELSVPDEGLTNCFSERRWTELRFSNFAAAKVSCGFPRRPP